MSVNSIVPHPASIQLKDSGAFLLDRSAAIVSGGNGTENSEKFLRDYLQKHYGIAPKSKGKKRIELRIEENPQAVEGAYALEVLPGKVTITGYNEPGLFYGVQTFIQLLPVGFLHMSGFQLLLGDVQPRLIALVKGEFIAQILFLLQQIFHLLS